MEFAILLKIEENDPAFQIYSKVGEQLEEKGMLKLECQEAPTTEHPFLKVKMSEPGSTEALSLWIPCHYVVLVAGGDEDRRMGFNVRKP
jgi:hypothetical protein